MVVLVGDKQLWALEIPGAHSDIVVFGREVELAKPPVDDSQFFCLMVDDYVLGLDVPVHDAHGVGIVQSLQNLVNVVFAIAWSQQPE